MIARDHLPSFRHVAIGLIAIAALVLTVAGIAHTPPVRAFALRKTTDYLRGLGIDARASTLRYNLFLLRAEVTELELSSVSARNQPFFRVQRATVDLPWRTILSGSMAVESLELFNPRVTVRRLADGSSNVPVFPAADGAASTSTGPFILGRLTIDNLEATYEDEVRDVSIEIAGLSLDLKNSGALGSPASGTFSSPEGLTLRAGERAMTIQRFDGGLAFDGESLTIADLVIEAREGRIAVDGNVGLLTPDPAIDLTFSGEIDLNEAARWTEVDSVPAGRLSFNGRASGQPAALQLMVQLSGESLTWHGGSIDGKAEARIGAGGIFDGGEASLEWRDLDAATLGAAFAGDLPVRYGARLDGSLRATLAGNDWNDLAVSGTLISRGSPSNARLPISGRAELTMGHGSWSLTHDHALGSIRMAGTGSGLLDMQAPMVSTIGGRLSITVDELSRAVEDFHRAGIELPASLAESLHGRMTASAVLNGTVGEPIAEIALKVADLTAGGIGPAVLSAEGTVTTERGALRAFEIAAGPDRAEGSAAARWDDGALEGRVAVDAPELSRLLTQLPAAQRPDGSLSIAMTLSGTMSEPRTSGSVTGAAVAIAGQAIEQVSATFGSIGSAFDIDDLRLTQATGQLSARGHYDLSTGRYHVEADAENWEVQPGAPVTGRFSGRVAGEGTVSAPAGQGELTFVDVMYGEYPVGPGQVAVAIAEGKVSLTGSLSDLSTTVRGSMDVAAPHAFVGSLHVDRMTLSRLAGAAPVDGAANQTLASSLTGALALSAEVSGDLDHLAQTTADVQIDLIDAAIGTTPLAMDRPARFHYQQGRLVAEDAAARIGASSFELAGSLGEGSSSELYATIDGRLEDALAVARLLDPEMRIQGDGSIALRLAARGSLEAPSVSAHLTTKIDALVSGDLPPVTALVADAVYGDGRLTLMRGEASWQGATFSATADVPATLFAEYLPASYVKTLPLSTTPARLTARVESVTREVLAPFLADDALANIDARVSGTLELEATELNRASLSGRVTLDRADLELAGVPFRQLEPTTFTLTGGHVRVDALRWGGEGNELVVTGDVAAGSDRTDLNLEIQGALNVRMLSAFVPDMATRGMARVLLAVRGTTADPDVAGEIVLDAVDLAIREPRIAITNLGGTIQVTRDRATMSGLRGEANGGTITVAGAVRFPGLALEDGSFTLEGRRLALQLANGAQAELDADLTLTLSASDDPSLAGRVTVLRGSYREPISLADLTLGGDTAVIETAGLEDEGFAGRVRLNVALVTVDDIRVSNNYGRADLGANVRVLGTVGRPALGGRATIREGGQVFLGGNTYVIEQGTIDFIDPTRIAPDVNLRARTRIGGYDITLGVSGAPEALEHNLQSEPPLSESDIVSVLVTGRTLSEAGSAQREIAQDQVLGYLSGDLLGFAGRAVGLDAVRFERGLSADTLPTDLALFAGDEDPASRLTVSKNIRRDVEIVLSQNLRESGGLTWIAMYRPFAPIELRTISRDDGSRAYEFRHSLQFGGGVRSGTAAASREPRSTPRVAAVRFAGQPGFDAERLRSALDLESGDRFDFFKWQQDREALESFYHDRDFLEVQVGATREPAGDTGEPVTLVYTIERGPHTTLRIDGHSLPGSVMDRLREAWREAVFDGFLLDDVRESVRRHLIDEGYLQAIIEPTVVRPAADEKEIVVRIETGVRSSSRVVEFAGNKVMPADRLMASLAPIDISEVVWTDPDLIAAGLERFYRAEGFLTADVTVQPPVFDGSRARLSVEIEEGPQFVLARVIVDGAAAIDEATIRTAAGLSEGGAYSAIEADAARRRVEQAYRRRGFNRVRTTATATVDASRADVTLALAISEGPRQVLADIVISGAEATRAHVVTDNLALDPGEPVDLTAWYQARKRLYDTNVFRSVELDVEPMVESPSVEGEEPVRARLTLEEWPRYRFRYGFQLNDEVSPVAERQRELSPGLVADVQDRNLLGRAATTGIAVRLQDDFRIARTFFSTPTFLGLKIKSGVFFTRSRQDFNQDAAIAFIEDTTGVSLEQRLQPHPALELAYSYRLENKRTFDPDPNPFDPFPLDIRVRIGRFAGSVVSERRDDPFDATRGWFHSSTVEYSPELFGSDLRFLKYLGQAYYFRAFGPTDRLTVLASAARVGAGRGFGQDLIFSEKFFVGGANSVRGYPEDSLGERDFFGDAKGGNGLVLFNQEVRFPLYRWVRGVAFVDVGNVFPRASEMSLTDLSAGLGLGLRIRTPLALVRIDHATAMSPRTGERANRWYFSIGQAF